MIQKFFFLIIFICDSMNIIMGINRIITELHIYTNKTEKLIFNSNFHLSFYFYNDKMIYQNLILIKKVV